MMDKKLKILWVFTLGLIVLTVLGMKLAFGQESDRTVHVPSPLAGEDEKKVVLPAPGPGENLTVIVDLPAELPPRNVVRLPTRITEVKESNLLLRGGLTTGIMISSRMKSPFTGGLVGEIGKADSLWRLQGTFRVGNCEEDGNISLNSGLAVMASVTKNFRTGVGADLLYCSDVSGRPKENVRERIAGGSFRFELEQSHFVVAGSFGMGAATYPTPGGRETQAVPFGTLNLSYIWGR